MNPLATALSIDVSLLRLLSAEQAWYFNVLPVSLQGRKLMLYATAGTAGDGAVLNELEALLGKEISFLPVDGKLLQEVLGQYYTRQATDVRVKTLSYTGNQDDFLPHLISEAKLLKSSDIHLETYEDSCRIRIRIDGLMVVRYRLDRKDYPSLVNKIKIMSSLDISEKRLPQGGRIFYSDAVGKIDIRVSILPTLHGEKIVLRLLNNDATDIDIYKLGFSALDLHAYLEGIKRPNGILLISGPTGSGKTTTLYATLKVLNKETRNILTIEDPVEYTLEGINQVQLQENIGLNFAATLRTFLRQDPDVIMVGEIRDTETAHMAIRAALTGHLVLSTIHTNSAWGTISRLIDMGIPPYLLANTLNTTAAQRLVRVLCPHCKARQPFSDTLYPMQFAPPRPVTHHFVPQGCDHCFFTGYQGRKAVYEVVSIDRELADCIKKNEYDVAERFQARGIRTLAQNGFELFDTGVTSIDEIFPLLYTF